MSETTVVKAPGNPLKRLLSKASKSRTSLLGANEDATLDLEPPIKEEDQIDHSSDVAHTIPDDIPDEPLSPSIATEQDPSGHDNSKEKKKRVNIVQKLRRLTGDKRDKRAGSLELTEVQVADAPPTVPTGPSSEDVAAKVRDLLTSVPPFYPTVFAKAPASSSSTDTSGDLGGSKLLELLSDPALMSGSSTQESVWALLDRMPFKFKANILADSEATAHPDNSIMLCVPLDINEDTKVELAQYKLVDVPLDAFDLLSGKGEFSAAGWWPPWGKKPKPTEPPPTKEVRVWIPSSTKISVQFSWWGYRLWIPPPILKILDDKTLEATKRAAMITTALTWLLNHIPTTGLPVELTLVLTIAKAIVPILGYVGGFIAWYWSEVKSFDKGQGVVLSATWLLPIALIPGTWDFKEPDPPPVIPGPTGPTVPPPVTPPTDPIPPPVPDTPIVISPPPGYPAVSDGSPVLVSPNKDSVYTT